MQRANLRIYAMEYQNQVDDGAFQILLARLPEEIKKKTLTYRRWQDAYGCLFGKHLLVFALQNEGFSVDLNNLQFNGYGRPYLANGPDFNISHSGNRVVCILDKQGRVGIDLEEIRDLTITDFKDQFSGREWETILHADDPLAAFYYYWTAKECILKADGCGLNLSLASLKIENNTRIQLNDRNWNILRVSAFKDYACYIATEEPIIHLEVRELKPTDILSACDVLC